MIRVVLPQHLRTLAQATQEVQLSVEGAKTIHSVLAALTSKYPMLSGTILDQVSGQRRPFIRFFACGQDLSLEPSDSLLPEAVAAGKEPFRIVGAIAGG
jgi:sulfur-carrier protein